MDTDILTIGLGFLEGIALIISPCIWPVLPFILAGSLEGSKKRPLGIVFGFVLTFSLFTFFSRSLVRYSGIDLTLIRDMSYLLLLLLGIVMMSTYLSEKFSRFTRRIANTGSSFSTNQRGGFFSGILFGALIGLIWTPCAGPILAAVIVQTVIQTSSLISFLIVVAFGIGAAIPMLLIALFGRAIILKSKFIQTRGELLRKILGAIVIASVLYMIYGESLSFSFGNSTSSDIENPRLVDGLSVPYAAPEIAGIEAWVNSPPLRIEQLKGKVILVDFWTYSCINCVRTLPYLKDWYSKYHKNGFEIIGVHTPEFEFEKNLTNVKNAVNKFAIKYPVALDNNFVTWQHYANRYWPAHYLIDKNGVVVYQHFGEGSYNETENNIRFLLGLNAAKLTQEKSGNSEDAQTPETYLGYARMENFASPEPMLRNKAMVYSFPNTLSLNEWALQGSWLVSSQKIMSAQADAKLKINFTARKVYVVMGNSTDSPIQVKVSLNDKAIDTEKGKDIVSSTITVDRHDLYEVIALPSSSYGVLQLTASAPGLEIYTFTFGG